jgi:hypothetical protein
MNWKSQPTIQALVTFRAATEGGRRTPPHNSSEYRPHIVVGDPAQKLALLGPDNRTVVEDYLGVCFDGDGSPLDFGRAHDLRLRLIYFPQVDYSALVPGATFTIREGGTIVGSGIVRAYEPPVVV